ncbi:MAG: hypothetical protein M5R41_06025 [Bacteroidia bacterium]|nr:hypothetical protein [Bacteroidia bacterium]
MGTLQLLLVVVGVVVVGIAIVVGTNIFGSNSEEANKDAITQDCLRMVSAAEGYFRKPSMLGGGNNRFDNINMSHLGMNEGASPLETENINGKYTITKAAEAVLEVTGASLRNPKSMVVVSIDMTATTEKRMIVDYQNW